MSNYVIKYSVDSVATTTTTVAGAQIGLQNLFEATIDGQVINPSNVTGSMRYSGASSLAFTIPQLLDLPTTTENSVLKLSYGGKTILQTDMESADIDESPRTGSASYNGKRTINYGKSGSATLTLCTRRTLSNGELGREIFFNPRIKPGMTVSENGQSFVVGQVNFRVSPSTAKMTLTELTASEERAKSVAVSFTPSVFFIRTTGTSN